MTGALSRLLADYSPPQGQEPTGIAILRRVKSETKLESNPEIKPTAIDQHAELIRQVEMKARQEERQQAEEKLAQVLSAEKKRFEDELNAQRVIWVEQEGLQLSVQLTEALSNLERALSARVAKILSSFVSDSVRQQTIDDFEATLTALLSSSSGKLIRVAGPGDILSVIQVRMGIRGEAVEFIPNDDAEVTVISQDTKIETQISSWSNRLIDVLREA